MLVAMVSILVGTAMIGSGALLTFYGSVQTTATVSQSVLLDGNDYTQTIYHDFETTGGCTECFIHNLENKACVDAVVDFETTITPDDEGITVDYYTAKLQTKGVAVADWSDTQAYDGDKSAHLETTGDVGSGFEARVHIPFCCGDFTLGDLDTISWWEYNVKGYPPHVDVILDTDGDCEADDALVFEYAYNTMDHYAEGPMPYGALTGAWYQTFSDDGYGPATITDTSHAWLSSGPPGPPGGAGFQEGTLADWKAGLHGIDEDTKIVAIEIEIDNWVVQSEAFVDNIEINGDLRQLEEFILPLTLSPDEILYFYTEYTFAINIVPDTYIISTEIVPVI
jgi:hypothetical protein